MSDELNSQLRILSGYPAMVIRSPIDLAITAVKLVVDQCSCNVKVRIDLRFRI